MALKRLRARVLTDSRLSCCCTASFSLSATTGCEEKEDGNTIHLWGLSDRAKLDGFGGHWTIGGGCGGLGLGWEKRGFIFG
ncbi:hypothetical protein TorRG33x02_157920 [Trema orientale]|uniref:Uncharacterized protein n=1 Tax=Trema orientale TaxID=63057 RepID=A0A2P5ESB7_TREOI|nr:hypothetical protein TorRG33x02_157920 [Trema orientale]